MLLTLTCLARDARDLGYLLHKHPDRVHTRDLPFGAASVFYPEAGLDRCTAALMLTIDPVEIVRSGQGFWGLDQYVNDRPYVASSFLSVAMARTFGTAFSRRSRERPERVDETMPLQATVSALRCEDGRELIKRMFEPLGYDVESVGLPLDARLPWLGESHLFSVRIVGEQTVADLLTHLYVLLPVIDDDKHYYVGEDEIEKLLRRGEDWLPQHPEHELITRRYLRYRKRLTEEALSRLAVEEEPLTTTAMAEGPDPEAPLSLDALRLQTVADVLAAPAAGVRRVLDLGCGEGKLLAKLLDLPQFTEIAGMDVSPWALRRAARFLRLDRLPERKRDRLSLIQGSLLCEDDRLKGYDAAALVEVVEHVPLARLEHFEAVLFGHAAPQMVVMTTPNREYNVRFPSLAGGAFRHRGHEFEWTRDEFRDWARGVVDRHAYDVELGGIGPEDGDVGAPTQMAVFRARSSADKGGESGR